MARPRQPERVFGSDMISFACRLLRPAFQFDVAFEAGPGITALFGPSGSGKSTAIRLIAGLERPDEGRIAIGETTLLDTRAGIAVRPHRRRIGLVFQDALLFPHLSVKANLTYGRWFVPRDERRIGLEPVVDVLGIGHLLDRRPETLSGGERQRVAIGRALLTSPRLLLMDEPLASLDTRRKLEVLPFIETLRDEFGIPVVYVSHAVEEVARLARTVIRLDQGRVVATGSPSEILIPQALGAGADRFEAISVLSARVVAHRAEYGVTLLSHPAGEIVVPGCVQGEGPVRIAIRATNVTLARGVPGTASVRTSLQGEVRTIETDDGPFALVTLALPGGDTLKAYATRLAVDSIGLRPGDAVHALVKAVAIDERGVRGLRL